jgi:hypothetical protein
VGNLAEGAGNGLNPSRLLCMIEMASSLLDLFDIRFILVVGDHEAAGLLVVSGKIPHA